MEIIFWIFFGVFVYTYIGYPLALFFIGSLVARKEAHMSCNLPTVSLIVAAYNEEKSIRAKIENSLSLNYPKGLLEIIVVSDCSKDKTEDVVKEYLDENIKLLRLEARAGKTAAQNQGAKIAKGEVLIFSDATTIYDKGAVNKIIPHFNDKRVGCVGGRLIFINPRKEENPLAQKNLYERLEEFVRTRETNFKTTFGIDGCLYAVRKELFRPLPDNLTTDFVLPLVLVEDGYRVVFEKDALAYEELPVDPGYEFRRKIRTVRVGLTGLYYMKALLNPLKFGLWIPFGLISHKILRWMSPFLLLGLAASNLFLLNTPFYLTALICQIIIYFLAGFGYIFRRNNISRLFSIPLYFCILNLSAFLGFFEFIKGKRTEIWDTARA